MMLGCAAHVFSLVLCSIYNYLMLSPESLLVETKLDSNLEYKTLHCSKCFR